MAAGTSSAAPGSSSPSPSRNTRTRSTACPAGWRGHRSGATPTQGYSFCLEVDAEYRLHPDGGLHVAITATNRGSHTAPYGTGSHPYLTAGTPVVDDCELALPAACWLPTDERGIPSGPPAPVEGTPCDFRTPRPIAATRLDHALTALDRDCRAWAHLGANGGQRTRVGLWAARTTAGCRCSPATRYLWTAAARHWPSSL
jgi:Aldose 1-epimerase